MGSGGMFKRETAINGKRGNRDIVGSGSFQQCQTKHSIITLEYLPISNSHLEKNKCMLTRQRAPFTKSVVTLDYFLTSYR